MINKSTFEDHIDRFGMIVQKLGDAGDSCQRFGMFWMGTALRARFWMPNPQLMADVAMPTIGLNRLECPDEPGNYRRSPDTTQRHSACDRLTRDQAEGLGATFNLWHFNSSIKRRVQNHCRAFMKNMFKRFWFTNNKSYHGWEKDDPRVGTSKRDFGGFALLANCFRAMGWWWMWPVICVLDAALIFSAIRHRCFSNTDDVLNHTLRCAIAHAVYPTPTAWLANGINDPGDLSGRIKTYFTRRDSNGDHGPPMHLIWDYFLLNKFMRGCKQ